MNWRQSAKCAGADSEVFFDRDRTSEAKKFCAECPVAAFCLQAALDWEGDASRWHRFGIYGGKTSSERVRIANGVKVSAGIRGTRSRRCVRCGTLMANVVNSRKYCADCQVERGRERDREYHARKKVAA